MNVKKSIGALLAAGLLAFSLTACGGGDSADRMPAEAVLSEAKKACRTIGDLDMQASMQAVMKVSAKENGESHVAASYTDAQIIYRQDPVALSMTAERSASADGQMQTQAARILLVEEGGEYNVYANDGSNWTRGTVEYGDENYQKVKNFSMTPFQFGALTDAFHASSDTLQNKGVRSLDGKDAILVEGKLMSTTAILGLLQSNTGTKLPEEDTNAGITVMAYYDAETFLPLQIDLDMTELMNKAYNNSTDVTQYTLSIKDIAYGEEVEQVTVPAAAAKARPSTLDWSQIS